MPTVSADRLRCFVFSYKEGLLSKLAHDLKFRVERSTLTTDDAGVPREASFDLASLELVCQMVDGKEHGPMSSSDREKILGHALGEVLEAKRHPRATFTIDTVVPEGDGHRVTGTLTLHGRSRPLSFASHAEGNAEVAEIRLHQPDFGIEPFSAMLGALKVRPDVLVRIELQGDGR